MSAVHKTDADKTTVSLWLELTLDGETHTFELDASETRAVAVGSLLRADLRIDRPGVAPVHFHIEREHAALWIVPAYGNEDLRVNAVRLTGPRRIDESALIEFANVRIDARVVQRHSVSVSTAVSRCSGVEWKEGSEAEAALLFGRADAQERLINHGESIEHGAILTAPLQSFLSPPPRRKATQPPSSGSHEFRKDSNQGPATLLTGQTPPILSDASTDSKDAPQVPLGHDTIVMPPFWIRQSEVKECEASDGSTDSGPSVHAAGQQLNSISKRKASTMRGVVCHGLESLPRLDSGDSTEVLRPPVATTTLDRPCNAAQNWVARLGLLATRRPLLVWLVGAALTFVLAGLAALVGKQLPLFH